MPSKINNEDDLYLYLLESIKDLQRAEDEFSVYDFFSIEKEALFEVKARRTHYDQLLIEKSKYESVLEKAKELGYTAYYVCSTPDGVYVFDLDIINEPEWHTRYMPKTTSFSNREKKLKNVGYVDVCDSIKI